MPGGIVQHPPREVQDRVRKRLPSFPVEWFNTFASMYLTEYQHNAESPADVRRQMLKISKLAHELYLELPSIAPWSEERLDALWRGANAYGVDNIEQFAHSLRGLASSAQIAATDLATAPKSRPTGALRTLISRIAGRMEAEGLELNARPNGDLVWLVEEALQGYGHATGGVVKAVQRHLDRRQSLGRQ